MTRPDSADVRAHLLRLAKRHPRLMELRTVMTTAQGRPIDAVTVTDPTVHARHKQHALFVAGQHGNEESARLIALALLDHLLSPAGRLTLRRQKIVVMPNVSPDAAENDSYTTPAGIKPNLDHGPDGATSPEGKAVETIARELEPELFVDIHARGHAGCSYDMVLYPPTRVYTEDDNLLRAIAAEMAKAGARAGVPNITHPLTWPGWGSDDLNQPSTTCFAYRQFKSIVLLTETCEHNDVAYPASLRAKCGLARLTTLLAWGNRRHPCFSQSGYPCGLAAGMFWCGAMAVGADAAQRRRSRIELWQHVGGFKTLAPVLPEDAAKKVVKIEYDGPPLKHGVGILMRAAGRRQVKSVRADGRKLGRGAVDGYQSWHDGPSTFVVAALPTLAAGEHRIEARF
ncbi:MAG: M14 family zinc carboxypeptidase [Phycisphaeraceae bacterium]